MASTAAALHSDHVNLLVFRYLQEQGFETSARAFSKDWHRAAAVHDPEALPFAHDVNRNELVTVLQHGLSYDELWARTKKCERKFRWSGIVTREDGASAENGTVPRPPTARRKARPSTSRPPADEFPTPAPKRQRRSEGSDAQVNGDRENMDVDTASADGEEDGETASPNVGSEPEQVEVMERYDSMDVMVQTDYKSGPKTSTITWTIDKPGAAVQRATWNPRTESDGSKTLLTVGPKLYRFYQIPDSILDLKQLKHLDEPLLQEDGAVTAAAWRADGQAACCAIDDMRKLPGGAEVPQQILLEHRQDGNSTALQLGPPTLEPAGAVMGIHYSPDGKYILGVRTNLKRSLIQIWKCHSVEEKHAEVNGASEMAGSISSMTLPGQPLAWKFFDGELFDATWTADDTFVVCGERGLAALYQVDQGHNAATVLPAGSVAMRGLISRNANILSDTATWDKVQFDQRHRLAVFASSSEKRLVITPLIYDTELGSAIQNHLELPAGKNMEALMVQPWRKPTDDHDLSAERDKASLLATAFDDGSFTIHRLNNSASKNSSHWRKVVELWLADAPATALSWSPDGHHLAVSGADVVQIWHAASFTRRNGAIHLPRPAVTWRPEATKNGTPDAQQGDEVTQPSLSWSSDGESLVFAADRQVAVIRFNPSLKQDMTDEIEGN